MSSLLVILLVIFILSIIYLIYRHKQYNEILESFKGTIKVDDDEYKFKELNKSESKKVGWDGIWQNRSNNVYGQFIQNNDKVIVSLSDNILLGTEPLIKLKNRYELVTAPYHNGVFSNPDNKDATLTDYKKYNGLYRYNVNLYYEGEDMYKTELTRTDTVSNDHSIPSNTRLYIIIYDTSGDKHLGYSGGNLGDKNISNNIFVNNVKLEVNKDDDPQNLFLGIGQLSLDKKSFILKESIYNTYISSDLSLFVNNLSGTLSNNTISLLSPNKAGLTLTKKIDSSFHNTNFLPIISEESHLEYEGHNCPDSSSPCMDTSIGLSTSTYNGYSYNSCGTPTSTTDLTCKGDPSCVLYSPAPDGLTQCTNQPKNLYDYMNFMPVSALTKRSGNNFDICNYLNGFGPVSKYNGCILCYITNIGDVKTLNYQYFGALSGESSLITQYDKAYNYVNNKLLNVLRNRINKNDANTEVLCNYFINTEKDIDSCKKYVNSYQSITPNNNLYPAIWQIKPDNLSKDCSFTLNTFSDYDTGIKYPEFNNDRSTSLSVYDGGDKQKLMMENVNIIEETETLAYMTANLKTFNNRYLIPSNTKNGFLDSSNITYLSDKPENNGKWLIIRMTLNKSSDIKNIFN